MARYGSSYDAYRLSNSKAIPEYVGSAGPETIQVGQYLQGLYDTAQMGALQIDNGVQGITSLAQDRQLANELRDTTQGKLKEFATRKDYENLVPEVTQLGQTFANRYQELLQPMQQKAAYQKSLENKDLNLTSDQKRGLLELSDAGYTGLKRNAYGKFEGQYTGMTPDKNIDVNKWVDDRMKDFAISKGGSEIRNTNGTWMMKTGDKWERLAPGTIENALGAAASNDAEIQGYKNMMGAIAGHRAGNIWSNPNNLTSSPANKKLIDQATKLGLPVKELAQQYYNRLTQSNIDQNILKYATTKYTVDNKWHEGGIEGADPYALKAFDPKANPLGEVDLVTGPGVNVGNRLGATGTEMETRMQQSTQNMNAANIYLSQQKQRVARATGVSVDQVDDNKVIDWLARNDNQEMGKYRTNREAVEASTRDIADMNQVRDAAMDAAVKKATGGQQTYNEWKSSATSDFRKALTSGSLSRLTSDKIETMDEFGQSRYGTVDIKPSDAANWEVIDGGSKVAVGPTLTLRNKNTGQITTVRQDKPTKEMENLSRKFDRVNWKDSYKEAQGVNTNTTWMTMPRSSSDNGKVVKSTLGERVENVLRASSGALSIHDQLDNDLSTKDADRVKALIAAGKFDALGLGVDPKTGQQRVQLSVVMDPEASDPTDRFKTIMVGADSNIWSRVAAGVIQEGQKHMKSVSPDARAAAQNAVEFGNAFSPNSSYKTIANLQPGNKVDLTGPNGTIRVVPVNKGNGLSYEILQKGDDGQFKSLGKMDGSLQTTQFVDMLRSEGHKLEQK